MIAIMCIVVQARIDHGWGWVVKSAVKANIRRRKRRIAFKREVERADNQWSVITLRKERF
jgi:hypothetical protein